MRNKIKVVFVEIGHLDFFGVWGEINLKPHPLPSKVVRIRIDSFQVVRDNR